ncbi:MAG: VIT1/CCC1 transporter family protein [Desulfocapsaceae bacterium]|nr:VIT1/CCC1 transporter family protein [Desulfocapsaceae bacterium]
MTAFKESFHLEGGELIRQVTFGLNDGVVSIFALLAGLVGAGQSAETILITLLAASIAGALSMAAGEYVSNKSEADYYRHEIEQERLEIELCPHVELEELRLIYRKKGFDGQLLDDIVNTIARDKDLWVKEMVVDELGVADAEPDGGVKTAVVILFAFLGGAAFPTLPYVLAGMLGMQGMSTFIGATCITVIGLFMAGAMKKFVTGVNWFKSGMEMLGVGFFAFAISYFIGLLIPGAG